MSVQPTNESLLARIAKHDEAALLELYSRLAPMLLGLFSRVAPDSRQATAVVEEAFVRLWREAPRFPYEDASIAAWLTVMVRRAAINQRRLHGRRIAPGDSLPTVLARSYAWLPRPEEVARIEERRELLKKAVAQLPKPQRGALELAVFAGLSEEEIAQKLDEPLGRVKSALRAGMRFVRHRLCAVLGTWSANI
jgi:RNA polymerase sigma-70 factor (ECF subfamily)